MPQQKLLKTFKMDNRKIYEQLKEYMANRTPEQAKEDEELLEKWSNVGPTIDEYLKSVGFGK